MFGRNHGRSERQLLGLLRSGLLGRLPNRFGGVVACMTWLLSYHSHDYYFVKSEERRWCCLARELPIKIQLAAAPKVFFLPTTVAGLSRLVIVCCVIRVQLLARETQHHCNRAWFEHYCIILSIIYNVRGQRTVWRSNGVQNSVSVRLLGIVRNVLFLSIIIS